MEPNDKNEIAKKIIKESFSNIKTTPDQPGNKPSIVQSAILGTVAGLFSYWIGPVLLNVDTRGHNDEIAALLLAISITLLSTISNARKLCDNEKERVSVRRFNILKGGVLGGVGGIGLGQLAAISAIAGLGPLAIGGVAVGAGGALVYNKLSKKKYCPHLDCKAKGNCTQRVCRKCNRLFWPITTSFDCITTPNPDWYTLASHLQTGYGLSYIDSCLLLQEYSIHWIETGASTFNVSIDCQKFSDWAKQNKKIIIDFKGKAMKTMTYDERKFYLDRNNL